MNDKNMTFIKDEVETQRINKVSKSNSEILRSDIIL
jgi:hypothetical protein